MPPFDPAPTTPAGGQRYTEDQIWSARVCLYVHGDASRPKTFVKGLTIDGDTRRRDGSGLSLYVIYDSGVMPEPDVRDRMTKKMQQKTTDACGVETFIYDDPDMVGGPIAQ